MLERRYATYLREERGPVAVTLINYLGFIRRFLAERFGRGAVRPARLALHDVAKFMLRHIQTMSPGRAKLMGTALRSFLAFLFLSAETATDLLRAVPSVRQFRQRAVPKYITSEEVERVLAGCDLTTPIGRRDHAILLLLARFGLRGGEIGPKSNGLARRPARQRTAPRRATPLMEGFKDKIDPAQIDALVACVCTLK